jgi:hypothetical protein
MVNEFSAFNSEWTPLHGCTMSASTVNSLLLEPINRSVYSNLICSGVCELVVYEERRTENTRVPNGRCTSSQSSYDSAYHGTFTCSKLWYSTYYCLPHVAVGIIDILLGLLFSFRFLMALRSSQPLVCGTRGIMRLAFVLWIVPVFFGTFLYMTIYVL